MGVVPDIALVSLGTTPGLRRADDAFVDAARTAGVSCELIRVPIGVAGKLRRQITVTDLVEALAARRAARGVEARAIVYSAVTTALLQNPALPYAIRFDSPAALNRPAISGAGQRARERRLFARAAALLPWGDAAATAIPADARPASGNVIALHVPVDPPPVDRSRSGAALDDTDPPPDRGATRDIDALAYAGYPLKRGLDILVCAWAKAATPDARLVVAGIDRERGAQWLRERDIAVPENLEWRGLMDRDEWQATLARTRLFVNASRREDHGLSQLEALAAGAALVTVPSAGPYEALPLARTLDARLVATAVDANALAVALAAGLQVDVDEYAGRALPLLQPYRRESVQQVFEDQVLPALGLR